MDDQKLQIASNHPCAIALRILLVADSEATKSIVDATVAMGVFLVACGFVGERAARSLAFAVQ